MSNRVMRALAVRRKRQASDGAANQDAWPRYAAERSMLAVAVLDAARHAAAAADRDSMTKEIVS